MKNYQFAQQRLYTFLKMDQIINYLKSPANFPLPQGYENRQFTYLITYIGELFVQGYRLIENYGSLLLFSLMQFQFSNSSETKSERILKKLPPRFKILCLQMSSQDIFGDGKNRREQFNQMLLIGGILEEVQYHLLYLRQFRYSIIPQQTLATNGIPNSRQYFKKICWIEPKNGFRRLNFTDQGIQLHKILQIFIKGAGECRNLRVMKIMQKKNKFSYNLFKVINTACYIIGKEFLQNNYQIISSQKWVRKYTKKKFRRYDLLMRDQHKSLIIDWKFTKHKASQKLKDENIKQKSQIYCQLARKDFKNEVTLKLYCFHVSILNQNYHFFTSAKFMQQFQTISIEDCNLQEKMGLDLEADNSEISISDSDDPPNSDAIQQKVPVIQISSSQEQQQLSKSSKKLRQHQNTSKKANQLQFSNGDKKTQQLFTKKSQIKAQKQLLKQSFITFPIKVYEIQSD